MYDCIKTIDIFQKNIHLPIQSPQYKNLAKLFNHAKAINCLKILRLFSAIFSSDVKNRKIHTCAYLCAWLMVVTRCPEWHAAFNTLIHLPSSIKYHLY